jgi:hypothetical protein
MFWQFGRAVLGYLPAMMRQVYTAKRIKKNVELGVLPEGNCFTLRTSALEASGYVTVTNKTPLKLRVDRVYVQLSIGQNRARLQWLMPYEVDPGETVRIFCEGYMLAPAVKPPADERVGAHVGIWVCLADGDRMIQVSRNCDRIFHHEVV